MNVIKIHKPSYVEGALSILYKTQEDIKTEISKYEAAKTNPISTNYGREDKDGWIKIDELTREKKP